MIILIEFKNSTTVSDFGSMKELADYEAVSLTAGNFTANPGNFNYLPVQLTENTDLIKQYEIFYKSVNETKEVGIIDQFKPPVYLFVPKTKGNQTVNNILRDLFQACKKIKIKELLMTHWTYLNSSYPDVELASFVKFLSDNKNQIHLNKLYVDVDKRFFSKLYNDLKVLESK